MKNTYYKRFNYFYIYGVYINKDDKHPIAYKLGKTSYDPDKYNTQRLGFTHKKVYVFESNKNEIKEIELFMKRTIQCGYLSKEFYGAGYTETFKPSLLPIVTQYIWQHVK